MVLRNVVAMLRVSTPGQATDERMGLKRQQNDIDAFCKMYGLRIVEFFQIVMSGADVQRGRDFNRMLSMLKRPEIAGVVVCSLDRLLRAGKLSVMAVFKDFEDYHKYLFCDIRGTTEAAGGGLDLLNPHDQMLISLKVQMAGMEREVIVSRTANSRELKRADETASIDKRPKGVEHDRTSPKVNSGAFRYGEFALTAVKEAFMCFLRGDTLYSIQQTVRFGGELAFDSVPQLRYTLKNEWWIGYKTRKHKIIERSWDADREKWVKGKRVAHDKPIRSRTNLADAPLVTPEDFKRVQEMLAVNHAIYKKRKPRLDNFLSSGLLYCKCGALMYHVKGINGRADTYKCSNRHTGKTKCGEPIFRAKAVDDELKLQVQMYVGGENNQPFIEEGIRESLSAGRREELRIAVQVKKDRVTDLQRKTQRLRRQCEESDDLELGARLKAVNRELATANEDLRMAEHELAEVSDVEVQAAARQLSAEMKGFAEQLVQRQRALLQKYVERITPSLNELTGLVTVAIKIRVGYPEIEHVPGAPVMAHPVPNGDGALVPVRVKMNGETVFVDPTVRNKSKKSPSRTSWTRG